MGFKHQRLSDRLLAAPAHELYRGSYVYFGGTGAVGGTAVIKTLDLLEELMCLEPPAPDEVPVLVATGRTPKERGDFIDRVERLLSSRAGRKIRLIRTADGFMTPSGVVLNVPHFDISPLPVLSGITDQPEEQRRAFARDALAASGVHVDGADFLPSLLELVERGQTFRRFVESWRDAQAAGGHPAWCNAALVAIPIPSLIAYTEDWELAQTYLEGVTPQVVEQLKTAFERSIRDDLASIRRDGLARELIIAHTTSVGGMYDDIPGPDGEVHPRIRLGFSHSAKDQNLVEKQRSAERLTDEYSSRNIKVFITAAAIGIDDVPVREPVRLHSAVRRQLRALLDSLPSLPGRGKERKVALKSVRQTRPAFGLPMANVQVHPPLDAPLDGSAPASITYYPEPKPEREKDRGDLLRPTYALRSGENGVFTVANADALYRVMRVASASELAQALATVMVLGDDPRRPFFSEAGVCYYGETDNSRQVFDFLSHPTLQQVQLSGLDPMALQDLGSAKHQCELHLLGLLILLHRLRTLDLEAIPPYVDGERFDARGFFEQQSRPLTFEEISTWDVATLARELRILGTADKPEDLYALVHTRRRADELLFDNARIARRRVLGEVLHAVHAITSLGTPIVYEDDGEVRVRTGFYVAPLEKVLHSTDEIAACFRKAAEETGNAVEDVRDYHLCVGGFIDLRPHAIVCTSKSDRTPLAGRIFRVHTANELRAVLAGVEPYGFFATCGVAALLFRLQALGRTLGEAMMELGTLQEFRWQISRDASGHILLVPGAVEALRMVSEGLEKTTGTERLDGMWGYERRSPRERAAELRAAGKQSSGEPVPA
ncbi:MAG TPA: hypothetical protein VF006_31790 [Longimicrobium sp.]